MEWLAWIYMFAECGNSGLGRKKSMCENNRNANKCFSLELGVTRKCVMPPLLFNDLWRDVQAILVVVTFEMPRLPMWMKVCCSLQIQLICSKCWMYWVIYSNEQYGAETQFAKKQGSCVWKGKWGQWFQVSHCKNLMQVDENRHLALLKKERWWRHFKM